MLLGDTIAALSTAPGPAGVAVVRISGPDAADVLGRCFRRPGGRRPRPRQLHYGHVVDPTSGEIVDEAMACFLPPPHTYTREPSAEIHGHGGSIAPRRVLAAVLAAGARSAEAGELTLRAFLNGRLDLTQAESVLDVVEARTEAQLRLAQLGVGGGLSARLRPVREGVLDLLARLTATIDFPEDELPEATIEPPLRRLLADLDALLATADQGALLRSGARVAIVGPPNAGKSTLMNALLGHDRAIVAPTPGTTRDTLEDGLNLGGVPFVLVDTAGLRASDDPVERLGVTRARAAAASADLVLLVLDGSHPVPDDAPDLLDGRAPDLVALNKADLPAASPGAALARAAGAATLVRLSARTGRGLDGLRAALLDRAGLRPATVTAELLVANARHADLLRETREHLAAVLDGSYVKLPPDQTAAGLAAALDALGRITGETATDDLLAAIFSRFCIGK